LPYMGENGEENIGKMKSFPRRNAATGIRQRMHSLRTYTPRTSAETPPDVTDAPEWKPSDIGQDIFSFISEVRKWTKGGNVNESTVADAEREFAGKKIPELEALVLSRPANWLNIPDRWLGLANVLEKKYQDSSE